MATPAVIINGAGIGGLVLARSLLRRGVSFKLYESANKESFEKRHEYGIDLQPSTCRALSDLLQIEKSNFTKRVAVNSEAISGPSDDLKVNRNRLEQLLAEGLPESAFSLNYGNGEKANPPNVGEKIVIAADGVHSSVRKHLLPQSNPDVQPFTVFRVSKRLDHSAFDADFAQYFKNKSRLEQKLGNELLRIDLTGPLRQSKYMGITYTYSRPVHDENDPLFKPERATWDATELGSKFKGVVEDIRSKTKLDGAFDKIFNVDRIERDGDRLLHWLMRSILVDKSELKKAAKEKRVLFIGDAAHHQPIIGSEGANVVVEDAFDLAEFLDSSKAKERLDDLNLEDYYDRRFDAWTRDSHEAKARISQLHGETATSTGKL